jgi:hypothetical protein
VTVRAVPASSHGGHMKPSGTQGSLSCRNEFLHRVHSTVGARCWLRQKKHRGATLQV